MIYAGAREREWGGGREQQREMPTKYTSRFRFSMLDDAGRPKMEVATGSAQCNRHYIECMSFVCFSRLSFEKEQCVNAFNII